MWLERGGRTLPERGEGAGKATERGGELTAGGGELTGPIGPFLSSRRGFL